MKIRTRCGRSIEGTRLAPQGLPGSVGRVVPETSCTARHAGHFLDRHCAGRGGPRVQGSFRTADDRPRVSGLSLTVRAPALPAARRAAPRAVVAPCMVSNILARLPGIDVRDVREAPREPVRRSRPGSAP